MADNSSATPFGSPQTPDAQNDGAGINSPDLSKATLKPRVRSISSTAQMFNVISSVEMARREQNLKNGKIQAKLNSERPYSDRQLESEGLGYKSNFSTKPLATTVGKVAARLTKAVQSARYLTSAELPDDIPNAKAKTELFRREITNVIRRWKGWYNFINEVAVENSTFGWTTGLWLDNTSWHPIHGRQDMVFLPDGTKHDVTTTQFLAFKQYLMPHELADFVSNRQAATDAGWDVDAVVDSINKARPASMPGAGAAPYTDLRRYEDAIRESTVSASLVNGAKQIFLWHVLATEIDGKVSHYIGDGNARTELFAQEDRFDSIADCLTFFSYEQATGALMGSKGIGRDVYEIASVLDRARNEAVDRLQMSGKILLSGPTNQVSRFKLTVLGNVTIIPEGFKLEQNKIESSVSEFLELNTFLTGVLDQIAGGVTPKDFGRDRVTSTEVNLYADREEEKRDDIEARFIVQVGDLVSVMQRRICSAKCDDHSAKLAREKFLNLMSQEELDMLSEQPALRTIEDYTQSEAQQMSMWASSKRGDPLYNQVELAKREATALFGPEFAELVIAPQNDPAQTAEQIREQLMENGPIEKGIFVPVSPRDAHMIHIQVIKQTLAPVVQKAVAGDPQALLALGDYIKHWESHLDMALQGGDKKALAPEVKELQGVAKQYGELQAQAQQKAQAAQAAAAHQAALAQPVAPGLTSGTPGTAPAAAPQPSPAPGAPAQ